MNENHSHNVFTWAAGINIAFVLVEGLAGWLANSTALWADAAHNLSDVAGLVFAWGAASLAKSPRTLRRTYGFHKVPLFAAIVNALLLGTAVLGVTWEAISHLREPSIPNGPVVIVVALLGVIINGGSAALFAKARQHDVNTRGVFLHLAADAAVSLVVVLSGVLVTVTRAPWIDPAASIAVSAVALFGVWKLLRESVDLALDTVPLSIDTETVQKVLASLPGVKHVHDLHIWALGSQQIALTAHLVLPWPDRQPDFLQDVGVVMRERFGIGHVTLQLEEETKSPIQGCTAGCEK